MKQSKTLINSNILVRFFSSVKLAVSLFILLAVTSIIGTVLPQGEPLRVYLEQYGPFWFKVIKALQLYDTYNSWWYLGLLGLFSINLIVCTINRFPFTLRLYKRDFMGISPEQLRSRPLKQEWHLKPHTDPAQLQKRLSKYLKGARSAGVKGNAKDGWLLFRETGKWSYWGVYAIHISILVILSGAVYGSMTGFKGRMNILEGTSSHLVFIPDPHGEDREIPLDFNVKCEKFVLDFYDTGAPKLYRSDLVIIENGKQVLKRSIEVNNPLTYKGVTFYQSSYQSLPEAHIRVKTPTGTDKVVSVSAFYRTNLPDTSLVMALLRYVPNVHGMPAVRLYIGDEEGRGDALWLIKGHEKEFKAGSRVFRLVFESIDEKFITGLQVKKDPGVLIVWLGFALMVFGFGAVFWVAHKRIWLWIGEEKGRPTVILAGQTSKNRMGFEKEFNRLAEKIQQELEE